MTSSHYVTAERKGVVGKPDARRFGSGAGRREEGHLPHLLWVELWPPKKTHSSPSPHYL